MGRSLCSVAMRRVRVGASPALHQAAPLKPPLSLIRQYNTRPPDDGPETDTDFILSILRSSPSMRDSRSYLASFAPSPSSSLPEQSVASNSTNRDLAPFSTVLPEPLAPSPSQPAPDNPLVASLLNPRPRRPALVKIQGPFTDPQLDSISRGLTSLQKLGLVSVIVMDRDDLPSTEPSDIAAASRQRTLVLRDVERLVQCFAKRGSTARPILATVARLDDTGRGGKPESVYVEQEGVDHIYRAVSEGEIPVLLPVALDSGCRSRRIPSNDILLALAQAMSDPSLYSSSSASRPQIDLTPLRLLIINREGGIPSYARNGYPHLSINLSSEFQYINDTFLPSWSHSHPSALANLALANECLSHLPVEASALIVSHRSPAALIANLITNKPAHSASLPHSLLSQSEGRLTRDTPTLIRKGLPVRILRTVDEIDRPKLKRLLETSFRKELNEGPFYARLERDLDFVIVVGDYAGAAIVTLEGRGTSESEPAGICYLDKFAVHPSHQGDGTVDFLWVALRDETYGLGLMDAANPSIGSLSGRGRGKDLVWRSRGENPVNKWYFERSSGFVRLGGGNAEKEAEEEAGLVISGGKKQKQKDGGWKMFWCDAEQRLRELAKDEGREFAGGRLVKVIEDKEKGRLERWAPVIERIPSVWK